MIGARRAVLLGGAGWQNVAMPNAAFSYVPFTIQQKSGIVRVDPSFDLQTHANITVAKTYYVDINTGNDGRSGADWENALKSVDVAMLKSDVDRIYIAKGYYPASESAVGVNPTRSIEIIGDLDHGVGDGVYLTGDYYNTMSAWSPTDSHYSATTAAGTIRAVWDESNLNSYGHARLLTKVADEATVDSTPNSWYYSGGTLYLRTFDSRAPDSNLKIVVSVFPIQIIRNNLTFYFENLTFLYGRQGCVQFESATATGGLKVYAKNCTFGYSSEGDVYDCNGVTESIIQDCTVYGSAISDGMNYHVVNSVVTNAVEIDCTSFDHGNGSTDQASTLHDGINIVRVNGKYYGVAGQAVADVGAGYVWMLGSEIYNSSIGIGYYAETTSWLDHLWSHDNATYDLQNTAGSTIYHRNCTLEKGVNDIGGSLVAY